MECKFVSALTVALALQVIGATRPTCPSDPNCVCGGTLAVELNCNIDGRIIKINLLPDTYINIKCENTTSLDYNRLPQCANRKNTFKSVSFKDCPLPLMSFKDVLTNMGVSKTRALIFQNTKKLSGYLDRKHFAGLKDLTKLLLSINGVTNLPDNLFTDINNLTWLNIRSNSIYLSEELFKPLEKLETLEISHNHMTNISSNLFSHLSFLRKLSLWQNNVTWFSKDFFNGIDVLEELDLSSNELNELPVLIFNPLKKLKKLTLFSNKFYSLPRNLFQSNDKLETVIILNNDVKLRELPKNLFGGLSHLRQIYIQRCGLENIPYDLFANSPLITNISLAYNDIEILQESTFNDQINLLELDLSHNNLKDLEPKIFSSLVRLEKLNLQHNYLKSIFGSTFSSLLSLIYLNMENNNLKTISGYLFSNNKQRMSISLAYNRLDFESKDLENNSWVTTTISPFANTYNLKLLNLSHNLFKESFEDWWINGHDILDISYNSIKYLWAKNSSTDLMDSTLNHKEFWTKPLKEIWIAHNPLKCECRNLGSLSILERKIKLKIADINKLQCPIWIKEACQLHQNQFIIYMYIFLSLLIASIVTMIICIINRKRIYLLVKNGMSSYFRAEPAKIKKIALHYSENDEEFVVQELVPGLKDVGYDIKENIYVHTLQNANKKRGSKNYLTSSVKDVNTKLVVFSPNYLTSAYSDVNIKRIRGEMLKTKNTLYVFVDIGPDNSIYAFLKEQRDRRTTLLWSEPDFWNTLIVMLSNRDRNKKIGTVSGADDSLTTNNKFPYNAKIKFSSNGSFSRLPECTNFYALDAFSYSQV